MLQHNTFTLPHKPRCRADNRHYVKLSGGDFEKHITATAPSGQDTGVSYRSGDTANPSVPPPIPLGPSPLTDEEVRLLQQELAQANQKLTGSLATAFTSATVGAALIAAGILNIPRPCGAGIAPDKCIPDGWNAAYLLMPMVAVLVAILVLETAARYLSLSIYVTDLERHLNRSRPLPVVAVDGDGDRRQRLVPSSEQMLAGFVSENKRRFSIRPINGLLWIACLLVLIAAIAIPIGLLHSLPLRLIAVLAYGQVLYVIARYTVALTSNPREYTHELWANGLAAAGTSASRHARVRDDYAFLRFLVYPRPLGDHLIKLLISLIALAAAYFAVAPGGLSVGYGLAAWCYLELVLYPIRYQINDIRDHAADAAHPAGDTRRRARFAVPPDRERVLAATMIYRILIFATLAYLYRATAAQWLALAGVTLVFAVSTWTYERLKRSFRTTPMTSLTAVTGRRVPALITVCASGYGLRIGFVYLAAVSPALTQPVLWWMAVLVVSTIIAEWQLLANQWAVEGTTFLDPPLPSRSASAELLTRPHIVACLRAMGLLSLERVSACSPQQQSMRWRRSRRGAGPVATDSTEEDARSPIERLVPRWEHLRAGGTRAYSHYSLVAATVLMVSGTVVLGPDRYRGARAGCWLAIAVALVMADVAATHLRRRALRHSERRRAAHWPRGDYRHQPLISGVLIAVVVTGLAAAAVVDCRWFGLPARHAGVVTIAAALWLMIVTGESVSYAEQRTASRGVANLADALPKIPTTLRQSVFGTRGHDDPAR